MRPRKPELDLVKCTLGKAVLWAGTVHGLLTWHSSGLKS